MCCYEFWGSNRRGIKLNLESRKGNVNSSWLMCYQNFDLYRLSFFPSSFIYKKRNKPKQKLKKLLTAITIHVTENLEGIT